MANKRALGDYDTDVDRILRVDGLTPTTAERTKLTEAIKLAAEDEFLGSMVGSEPLPTAMTDLRALRLRRICEYAKRSLSAQEIAAIFRMSTRQAVRLHEHMESSYPLLAKEWQLGAVRSSAKNVELPLEAPAKGDAEIVVTFKRRDGPLAAERLIERAGLGDKATVSDFRVVIPIGTTPSEAHAIVTDTLGLAAMHKKSIQKAKATGKTGLLAWFKGY